MRSVITVVVMLVMATAIISTPFYPRSAQAQGSTTVRIATDKLIGGIPLFIVLNENLLKQQNINSVYDFFPTSSQVAQSMITGRYDMGGPISTIDMSVIESKNPGKFKIFSLLGEKTTNPVSNILVKKDSPYKSIKDLQGKKLGIAPGVFFDFTSKILLEKYFNNNANSMQLITVPPGSWASALQTGAVDGVYSIEPYTTTMSQSGNVRSLLSGPQSAVIDPIPTVGFAFTTDFVNKNPQLASQIVKAIDNATATAKNDHEKAVSAISAFTGIDKNVADKVKFNVFYNSTQLDNIKPQFQKLADLLFQKGYMSKKIDVGNMFYK